jgi:hypothetical protein
MQPYNLKYYTDGTHGYTPTSFALAQIVHNTASLIDAIGSSTMKLMS